MLEILKDEFFKLEAEDCCLHILAALPQHFNGYITQVLVLM